MHPFTSKETEKWHAEISGPFAQAGVDGAGNGYLGHNGWIGPVAFGALGTYIAPFPPIDNSLVVWSYLAKFGNVTASA